MHELVIETKKKEEIIDLTEKINEVVKKNKIKEGICFLYTCHATAALTINENYAPAVCEDFLKALSKIAPQGVWKHDKVDNNGAAHIKSAIIGPSSIILIKNSELLLGRWQGIMFCEFDGPRKRKIIIKILKK